MKVGIVGLGFRLGYLGHVFRALDHDFEIAGYVDPAPAGLPTLEKHGISPGRAYATPQELVTNEKLDLLMIGSPNHLHLEHIRFGLTETDLKIFCEKPIVSTMEQTYELAALLARHGSERLMVGLVLRYSPHFRRVMAAKAEGMLGEVVSIEASEHIEPEHGAFFMRDWRRYEQYAGGFMLEKCCHDLDLYNAIVGFRPERVASFGGRKSFVPDNSPANDGVNDLDIYHRKPSGWLGTDKVFDSDATIVDYQTAIVEYANGAAMAFHTNLNVPDQFRRFCIIGSKGMAEGDFIRGFVDIHDARTGKKVAEERYTTRTELSQHYGADEQMAADILAHMKAGVPLPVSAIDAMEAGILAMAMDEARRTRSVVDLRPIWDRFDQALRHNAA
jgi:predicted dehydrogenase